jgi:mRNA interferase MazF
LKRGDLVSIALAGDFSKPRPAIVVQTGHVPFTDTVLVCMITSVLTSPGPFRVDIPSDVQTGLAKPSQVMADKTFASLRRKCGPVFGNASDSVMTELGTALAFILGIGSS